MSEAQEHKIPGHSTAVEKQAPASPFDPVEDVKARGQARSAKRIKILRVGVRHGTYLHTATTPNAWPSAPNVVPTLLMFSVAIAALVFDACMLIAYLWPTTRYAQWAVLIGGGAHSVVTSAKTVAYAISAVISKTSLDYGSSSGLNSDLWSYTCSDQASAMDALIQASSNCDTQYAAWSFALVELFIEVLGWLITVLSLFQKSDKLNAQAIEERFTGFNNDVNSKLSAGTPQFDLNL